MGKIIKEVKLVNDGYELGNKQIKILGYADDIVLISQSGNGLQRLLYKFKQAAERYNMEVNTDKTKYNTIAKESERYKLEINEKIIE